MRVAGYKIVSLVFALSSFAVAADQDRAIWAPGFYSCMNSENPAIMLTLRVNPAREQVQEHPVRMSSLNSFSLEDIRLYSMQALAGSSTLVASTRPGRVTLPPGTNSDALALVILGFAEAAARTSIPNYPYVVAYRRSDRQILNVRSVGDSQAIDLSAYSLRGQIRRDVDGQVRVGAGHIAAASLLVSKATGRVTHARVQINQEAGDYNLTEIGATLATNQPLLQTTGFDHPTFLTCSFR